MGLSTTHLIIFLVIIVLIFGTKKLKNLGADLGSAVKGFKDGVKDGTTSAATADKPAEPAAQVGAEKRVDNNTIDVEARNKS